MNDNISVKSKITLSKIVLAGNPNVGKSVFFNKFTGNYVEISNYPGTTVDISKAVIDNMEIIDTPGIYGIGSFNEEEIVAKDIILQADKIINIVSALSLERDLFLTQQLIDLGFPIIVVLNQIDEAKARGVKIDKEILESMLGVIVIPTIATKNEGIQEVRDNIINTRKGKPFPYLDALCHAELISASQLFEIPKQVRDDGLTKDEILALEENLETRDKLYSQRRQWINKIIENVVSETTQGINFSTFLGKALLNPVAGFLSSMLILYLLYQIVGVLISGNLVDFLQKQIFLKYYFPWITGIISNVSSNEIFKQIFVGEFGLLTMTVQYIIGVLLPLIFSFYIFMSFLEDSGYLPRLAVLTDRYLAKMGLNGRAIIPLVLGFGCTTMATITTRILGSKRERTIATLLLGIVVPCSAQLGIIVGLMAAAGGLKAWIIYIMTIFIIMVIIGTAANKLLPGKSTYLLIDLPPMRFPVLKNVLDKTMLKTWHFLKEATPLFFLGSFLVSILQISGGLNLIEKALSPLTVNCLHLPKEVSTVFIMGLIRRDFGAAGLAQMAGIGVKAAILSPTQILVCLVVITLFVPCIASVIVMFKERGVKEALLIWTGSWIIAFLAGGILSRILMMVM